MPRSESGLGCTETVTAVWVAYCTVENAKRAYEDIEKIARDLSDRAQVEHMPNYPFGSPESSLLKIIGDVITGGTGKLTPEGGTPVVNQAQDQNQKEG